MIINHIEGEKYFKFNLKLCKEYILCILCGPSIETETKFNFERINHPFLINNVFINCSRKRINVYQILALQLSMWLENIHKF